MKPATASLDNTAFSVQKLIFEFALWARTISILDALATQFHEKSGLITFPHAPLISGNQSLEFLAKGSMGLFRIG